ncbi:MAG: hypothetical protein RLZZ312_1747 [Bacteroidota bacterium]|jgi:preprotein translocase subunit YajC
MKQSILQYALILLILLNIFTYMFLRSQVKFEQKRADDIDKKFTDTVMSLINNLDDANHFSIEKNQNAQDYFENKQTGSYIDAQKMAISVADALKDFNINEKGNPYTGQEPMNGKKFIINKVKILNHRWIIIDFNNGDIWGEAIIKYFINDKGAFSFETTESVIYPN